MQFLSARKAFYVSKWFLLLLFPSTLFAQVQSTLQATLFYEDKNAVFRGFNQPVVDHNGNVIVFGTQFGFDCPFDVCGVVIYSIAPNGKPNWIKPDTGFAAPAVNQVAIGLDDTIYFQGFPALSLVFAYDRTGNPVPNWPVISDLPLDTAPKTLLVDPLDGSIIVKRGTSFSFSTFPGRISSYRPDGSEKWPAANFPQMANNTPGMFIGPNDDIYTYADRTVIVHGSDGSVACEATDSSFAPLTGGSKGVFSEAGPNILKINPDCTATVFFTSDRGTVALADYDNGIVFATDFPFAPFDPTKIRLIGVKPDGTFWRNENFIPTSIGAKSNSTLYVIGTDVVDQKQKLFLVDEGSGATRSAFDTSGFCQSCGVAVDASGTIYVNDLGSTRIYKISPPPPPTPIALVIPGLGASTLTDSSGSDQWLSCSSIVTLNDTNFANRFAPLQLDMNGEPHFLLSPREILAQSDSISDVEKPSNQSLVQCNDFDLQKEAVAANWEGLFLPILCGNPISPTYHSCLQKTIVANSDGTLLQFNDLLSRLSKEGYDPQTWPYDFRRGVPELADDLFSTIQRLSASQGGRRVAIVAHSMGSIITASMIVRHPEIYSSGTLKNIITIGAPFGGGLGSYLSLQGWESFVPFVGASDTKSLGQNWTSAYDLLPQWDFVKSWTGTVVVPYLSNQTVFAGTEEFPALHRQNALPGAYQLWSDLATSSAIPLPLDRWYALIGYGEKTEYQLTKVAGSVPGSCINSNIGCSTTHTCWFKEFTDGDGTVPRSQSAEAGRLVPEGNRIYANGKHSALPGNSDVINGIVQILNGNSPFSVKGLTPAPPQFDGAPADRFTSCSPVDLVAINSAGQSVGDAGVQIHGADYTKIAGSTQITVPSNDSYVLQAKGTALGTFEIVVGQMDAKLQPSTIAVLSGIAGPNSVTQFQVNSAGTGVPAIVLIATFASTFDDISNSLKLGLIDNAGVANSLSMKLKAAQATAAHSRLNLLNALVDELNAQTGKHVNGVAAQVLTADINSLIAQLL